MVVISCDPGLHGAVAVWKKNKLVSVTSIPFLEDEDELGGVSYVDFYTLQKRLWKMTEAEEEVWGVIEEPFVIPGQSIKGALTMGTVYGQLVSVLHTLVTHSVYVVHPRAWKEDLGLSKDKSLSISLCRKVIGEKAMFKVGKDHNKAEAILIGHWFLSVICSAT
jgi:hypothetical protein